MADASVQDLPGLDREVARAAAALERWRADLEGDAEAAADRDPFEGVRRVAAKSTWDELGALPVPSGDEPLRDGLRRWIASLVQARLGGADDVARAREMASARGRLEGNPPRLVSWREAWRGVVGAKSVGETRRWLEAAGETAPPLIDANRTRAARRVEVARRLGLQHPWEALVSPAVAAALRASASRMLDATEDLSKAVWKESLRGASPPRGPAEVLHAVVAREAGEGWPARLTSQWLADAFGAGVRKLAIRLPALPRVVGAASFARGLCVFGHAVRLATAPSSMPFAVRRDPAFVAAHRAAFLFGGVAHDLEFQTRALGLGRARAQAQCRVLARTALFDVRLHAARLLLGDDAAFAPRDAFDEIGDRLFGAPLDRRLLGAWPPARDDEPARWVALTQATAERHAMRERFDADWFRNPRAWSFLAAQGATPAHEPLGDGALDAGGAALAVALEEALA